jgi:hypothetical protein
MTHEEFSSRGGKIGGRSKSPAKLAACRANAKLGGRKKGSKNRKLSELKKSK